MKIKSSFKAKILYILGALIMIVGIQLLFSFSLGFKSFYIFHLYPFLSSILRAALGWFPFSIGDIVYLLAGLWLLIGLISFFNKIIHLKRYYKALISLVLRFIFILLTIYFIFLLFWGLNYRTNRIYADFKIASTSTHSEKELKNLCDTLVKKINALHYTLTGSDSLPLETAFNFSTIKKQAVKDYGRMAEEYKSFHYRFGSVKPSMFGQFMNYSGVTGYYNPFTGEAQVNTTPPKVEIPFTTCHEIAHQIGFAAEEDANFIGYWVAATSPDPLFRYSANFSLLLYALNDLSPKSKKWKDSLWNKRLMPGVRKDYDNYFDFFKKFETPVRNWSDQAYDGYLKANDQKEGIKSYRGIVALVLAYQKKYGAIQ